MSALKKVSAIAVAAILYTGNLTTSTENYYEDDNDFTSISTQLTSGWSWSFNSAHACSSSDTECIEVYGSYDSWDDWFWDTTDTYDDSYDYDDYDGGGGGGGSNTSNPDNMSLEEKKRLCHFQNDIFKDRCETEVAAFTTSSLVLCAGFTLPPAQAACAAALTVGGLLSSHDCRENYTIQKYTCDALKK